MAQAGPGARGIVFAYEGNFADSHYCNVVNQRGVVQFLDGQRGTAARVEEFIEFGLLRTN